MGLVHRESVFSSIQSPSTVASLLLEATRVFGDTTETSEWVNEPIPSLGGRKPLELWTGTPEEQQRVLTILGRIEHGIFRCEGGASAVSFILSGGEWRGCQALRRTVESRACTGNIRGTESSPVHSGAAGSFGALAAGRSIHPHSDPGRCGNSRSGSSGPA